MITLGTITIGDAQTMDPYFARQSMDRVSKGAKYKFAVNPWIALRKQLIAWFARWSSPNPGLSQVYIVIQISFLCKSV